MIRARLERLEQRQKPSPGMLPVVVVLPDEPERAQVLADVQSRRARGEHVICVGPGEDELSALVDCFV